MRNQNYNTQLISQGDLEGILRVTGSRIPVGVFKKIIDFEGLNQLYRDVISRPGENIVQGILDVLNIKFRYGKNGLKSIPVEGPFITISNHPFGVVDGLVLIQLLQEKRPGFKLLANFVLLRIKELKDVFIGVNPFPKEELKKQYSNVRGIMEATNHLRKGHPLGIFPAGYVSTFSFKEGKIIDREWSDGIVKFILNAKVPVIPVFFSGSNSRTYYLLSWLSPLFRTLLIPREFLKKRNETIKVTLGEPLEFEKCSVAQARRLLSQSIYDLKYQS